ncbi:unnamed protein product [Dracunculus medinensis]|uniref:Paired domain-containing protein n=1 Tax=Dracunculus medinensis TaxID=318479 RepID=A0A3P7PTM6_DRAME|nr:unnamed protein product [Dracunculus medinensis]
MSRTIQDRKEFLHRIPVPIFPSTKLLADFSFLNDVCNFEEIVSKNKLGRSYNPGKPLAMSERRKILDLYEKGHKISHIARIIGVTHSCVSKIMSRYRRTGSMQPRSTCNNRRHYGTCGRMLVEKGTNNANANDSKSQAEFRRGFCPNNFSAPIKSSYSISR